MTYVNKFGDVVRGLTFPPEEWSWVEELSKEVKRPKTAVVRKALRTYALLLYVTSGRKYPPSAEYVREEFEEIIKRIRDAR